MKQFLIVLIISLCISCSSSKKISSTVYPFNGIWITTAMVMDGKELPAAAVANQKLEIKDSLYIYTAESIDKGIVRYNGNKIDLYGKEGVNAGKHFTAIYKFENDKLFICYNLAGDSYPESFETKGKPMYFVSVFKKE